MFQLRPRQESDVWQQTSKRGCHVATIVCLALRFFFPSEPYYTTYRCQPIPEPCMPTSLEHIPLLVPSYS